MPRLVSDPVAVALTRLSGRWRLALVIFGAVMIHLSLGTYHTFGNMLPYMASYMRNYTDHSLRLEQLIWIPTLQGCFPLSMVAGGLLAGRVGPRGAAATGCFLMSLGVMLSTWTIRHSYASFLLTYGAMFGLGQGMAYVIAVSCVINWAPHMVGLGSGMVAAGFGIASSLFAPLQTWLINWENFPPTRDGYFLQRELLERVPGVFFELGVTYFLMQCAGLVFTCDPPAEFAKRQLNANDSALIDMAWLSRRRTHWMSQILGTDSTKTKANGHASFHRYGYARLATHAEEEGEESETDRKTAAEDEEDCVHISAQAAPESLDASQMFRSSTFYFLFLSLFCCSFYGNLFYNLYKTFGETFIDDDYFMAIAFSLGSVANACARIGWGLLTDRTSFQFSLSTASCIATALLLTLPLTPTLGRGAFLLWLVGMFICMAATHALFITAVVRCFGTRHKATNYGFLMLSTTASGVLLALGCEYFLQQIGYTLAFMFAAAFPFTAFLLTSAIRITPHGHLIV